MASLTQLPNKTRAIRTLPSLGRKVIRLGRCNAKQARAAHTHIEALEASRVSGHPAPDATQRWLREIDRVLYDRIVRAGLVEGRRHYTLGEWIERCIEQTEKNAVAGTITRLRQSQRSATAHLGEGRSLSSISIGQAEDYAAAILSGDLAEGTARKRIGDLKQWMGKAVKHNLIDTNPFADIKTTVPPTKNHRYISDDKAHEVMRQLKTPVLRAAFALSRWGGLRTASEHARMRWLDFDWDRERFIVHGKGNQDRLVPIFPELVEPLDELAKVSMAGATEVFPGMQPASSYLSRPVKQAIKDAGYKVWPRLFHNLRASRQTDLIDRYGIKTACAWLGNSPVVAMKHYMMERDREDAFKRAAKSATHLGQIGGNWGKEKPASGPEKAARGCPSDPYGMRTWLRGACTDNYLQAFQERRAAICAAVAQ